MRYHFAGVIAVALMLPDLAAAQAASTGPSADQGKAAPDDGAELREIVVTAQRRAENIQKVPVSVLAVDADSLESANVKNIADLGIVAPSLNFIDDGAYAHPYLRGVGTASQGPGVENPVAVYIDGVYQAASVGGAMDFNNVKEVEVINGPQGTLFGRNATAGLIQIRTLDPSHDLSGQASVGYGNYNTVQSSAYVTGGLTDTMAANVAVDFSDQSDGYFRNVVDGRDVDKTRKVFIRSKLLFEPVDRVRLILAGNYAHVDFDPLDAPVPGSIPLGGVVPGLGERQYSSAVPADGRITQYGTSLTADIDFDALHFQSISAYQALSSEQLFGDISTSVAASYNVDIHEPHRQFSQEFQLSSLPGGDLTWTTGLYYFHETAKYDPTHLFGDSLFPLSDLYFHTVDKTDSYAPYAQATYELTPTTRLTTGVRYTWERRSNEIDQTLIGDPAILGASPIEITAGGRQTFQAPTWRIAVDQDITQDVLAYASYNRGFKSGGFNNTQLPSLSYKPEKLDAYEIGLKTQLFARHLRLNVAGFYYNYSQIQILSYPDNVLVVTNGAKARLYGADITADAVLTRQFRINAGLNLLNTRFTSYPAAAESVPAPGGGNVYVDTDATGRRLPNAPDKIATLGATYTIPTSVGHFDLNANYAYNGGWDGEVGGRLHQGAYSLLNGQIAWTPNDGKFELAVWGKNLTDTKYALTKFSTNDSDRVKWAPPRTYGITGKVKF